MVPIRWLILSNGTILKLMKPASWQVFWTIPSNSMPMSPYPMGVGNTSSMGNNHSHVVFTYIIFWVIMGSRVVFSNLVVYWQHPLLTWHSKTTVTGHTPLRQRGIAFFNFPYLPLPFLSSAYVVSPGPTSRNSFCLFSYFLSFHIQLSRRRRATSPDI